VLLAAIGVGFVQTLLFWVSRGLPAILVADVNGVLVAVAVTALVAKYCRAAAVWLLPYATWMILTTGIEITVIATGHPLI
jgi:tryptophan-rich sensory protein